MNGDTVTTERIISCAIEVHKYLGPGLLESVYESALCVEFKAKSLPFKRQVGIPLYYKGELISEAPSRLDRRRQGDRGGQGCRGSCTNPHGAITYLSEGDLTSRRTDP